MSDFLWMTKSKQNKYTFPLDVFLVGDHQRQLSTTTPTKEFDPVDFTSPSSSLKVKGSFSAVDFVNEYRSRVDSLNTLLEELQEFKEYLKDETISIIHKEYSSFIEFSRKLNTITVDQITSSMPSLIQQMKEFESFIHTLMSKCDKELQVKRRASQKEYISKKLLEIYQLIKCNVILRLDGEKEKINNLALFSMEDCIFSSISEHLKFCSNSLKQIEGTLLELSEENISTHTNMEKQHMVVLFEFYEKVDSLLKSAESIFLNQVASSFLFFINSNSQISKTAQQELYHIGLLKILDCMESLYLFGNISILEQKLALSIISPVLDSIFSKENLTQCKNNPEQHVKTLLFDAISSRLLLVVDPVLEINMIGDGTSRFLEGILSDYGITNEENYLSNFIKSYNFITTSVLQPIITKLHSENCKFLYEYRNIKTFHSMFLCQKQFIDNLRKQILPIHEEDTFSFTLQSVVRPKWQTKIYFALVKQQVVKDFEAALSSQSQSNQQVTLENTCDIKFKLATDKIVDIVKNSLFNPTSTFLPELTEDFLLLYIQIISRYQKWLTEQHITQVQVVCKNLAQDGSALLGNLCILVSKLFELGKRIIEIDFNIFTSKKDEISLFLDKSFRFRITTTHTGELSPVLILLVEKIKALLKDKCIGILSKASYNWTNPSGTSITTVSPFIAEVFKSLVQFKSNEGKNMSEELSTDILEQVLFDTCNQFKQDCLKIVEEYKKTQQSLDRLRKKKGSTNKTSSIQDQILRDCVKLEEIVREHISNSPNMRYAKALEELRSSLITNDQ